MNSAIADGHGVVYRTSNFNSGPSRPGRASPGTLCNVGPCDSAASMSGSSGTGSNQMARTPPLADREVSIGAILCFQIYIGTAEKVAYQGRFPKPASDGVRSN